MKKKLIIAHRGASRQAHENTLPAFLAAIKLGADGVELDVRKTKDNVLVCFHNKTILRRPVSGLNFTELNAAAKSLGFTVPTLKQALKFIGGKARVYIHLKAKGYEKQTAQSAISILDPENFTIISFHSDSLKVVKKFFPRVKVGLFVLELLDGLLILELLEKKKLSFIDFILPHFLLWESELVKMVPQKYSLVFWTVDRPGLIKRIFKDKRIRGIITNVPDVALKLRNEIYAQQK